MLSTCYKLSMQWWICTNWKRKKSSEAMVMMLEKVLKIQFFLHSLVSIVLSLLSLHVSYEKIFISTLKYSILLRWIATWWWISKCNKNEQKTVNTSSIKITFGMECIEFQSLHKNLSKVLLFWLNSPLFNFTPFWKYFQLYLKWNEKDEKAFFIQFFALL